MPRRTAPAASPGSGELRRVSVDRIEVPQHRLRRDLGDVASLAGSLETYGQLAPVVCYEGDAGQLRLIAGERRLEATRRLHAARIEARMAKPDSVAEIDVLVRRLGVRQDPAELELIENEQRRELTDEEEADAFIQLARVTRRTLQQLAEMSGRSEAYVSKRIRVFEDPQLRAAVASGDMATSQAEELLALEESLRGDLIRRSTAEGWAHDKLRDAVRALKAAHDTLTPRWGRALTRDEPELGSDFEDLEDFDESDLSEADTADHFRIETSAGANGADGARVLIERPRDLTRRIRELDAILAELRPFQLKPQDDRALASLWRTLRVVAQASRKRVAPTFPSVTAAEVVAGRRGRKVSSRNP